MFRRSIFVRSLSKLGCVDEKPWDGTNRIGFDRYFGNHDFTPYKRLPVWYYEWKRKIMTMSESKAAGRTLIIGVLVGTAVVSVVLERLVDPAVWGGAARNLVSRISPLPNASAVAPSSPTTTRTGSAVFAPEERKD